MATRVHSFTDDALGTLDATGIAEAIDELLGGAGRVVVPSGLPEAYRRAAARSGRELVEVGRSVIPGHGPKSAPP